MSVWVLIITIMATGEPTQRIPVMKFDDPADCQTEADTRTRLMQQFLKKHPEAAKTLKIKASCVEEIQV